MEVDMSDKAITGRLKRVEQLRRLCLSLAQAKPITTVSTTPSLPTSMPTTPSQDKQLNDLIIRKEKL